MAAPGFFQNGKSPTKKFPKSPQKTVVDGVIDNILNQISKCPPTVEAEILKQLIPKLQEKQNGLSAISEKKAELFSDNSNHHSNGSSNSRSSKKRKAEADSEEPIENFEDNTDTRKAPKPKKTRLSVQVTPFRPISPHADDEDRVTTPKINYSQNQEPVNAEVSTGSEVTLTERELQNLHRGQSLPELSPSLKF